MALAGRLQVVASASVRLRDEALAAILAGWPGPVARLIEPPDLDRILLDCATPSFLELPTLRVIRADEKYLKKHQAQLLPAVGQPADHGQLVLVVPGLDQREKFTKALAAAGALHLAPPPDGKAIQGWLVERLRRLPQAPADPLAVASELVQHVGEDCDQLLAVLDVAILYAAPAAVDAAAVRAIAPGVGERPLWEYIGALLEGRSGRAIELSHAGEGIEPQVAVASLSSELRKLVACCETADDAEVAALVGMKGRPNLYYARKRANELGRPLLLRLFQGVLQTQRQLRRSGGSPELALELLAVQAGRVVRPGR